MHCFATCLFHLAIYFRNWSMSGQWQPPYFFFVGPEWIVLSFSLWQTLLEEFLHPFPLSTLWLLETSHLSLCSSVPYGQYLSLCWAWGHLKDTYCPTWLTDWLCLSWGPLQAGTWLFIDMRVPAKAQIDFQWAGVFGACYIITAGQPPVSTGVSLRPPSQSWQLYKIRVIWK